MPVKIFWCISLREKKKNWRGSEMQDPTLIPVLFVCPHPIPTLLHGASRPIFTV